MDILIEPKIESLQESINAIEKSLYDINVKKEDVIRTLLIVEEVLVKMIEKSDRTSKIVVSISKLVGKTKLKVKSVGESFDKIDILSKDLFGINLDSDEESVVKRLIYRVIGNNITLKCSSGVNKCTIIVDESAYAKLAVTIAAIVLGVVLGLVFKLTLQAEVIKFLTTNIFNPIYTMFLNALKMIVAPLVFLSIATSVAGYDEIQSLGKIVGKALCIFIATSIIAMFVGYGLYHLFPIGDPSLKDAIIADTSTITNNASNMDISIKGFFVGIIPSDIVRPFLNTNMLQIIFISILLGYAISITGNDKVFAKCLFGAYEVINRVTTIIVWFLPISVFAAMAKMMMNTDFMSLVRVILWLVLVLAGHLFMQLVYSIMLIINRFKPSYFFANFFSVMATAFSMMSSNATMPVSMKVCDEKLHIPPKYYLFCIPFGATVNMNGSCVTLMVSSLFMMDIFGVSMTPHLLLTMMVSILLLTMGAPGVPGSGLICMALLFPTIGVPAEAIGIIMGVYSIAMMTQTVTNVTGDAVTTMIIAKDEITDSAARIK